MTEYYMCTINNLHRATAQACEFQLLFGQNYNCHYQTTALLPSIWHQVAPNQWLYIIHERDTLIVHDPIKGDQQIPLPTSGIITLPSGTTGYTTHRILHAGKQNSTTIQGLLQLPEMDLPEIHAPALPPGFKIPEISTLDTTAMTFSHDAFIKAHQSNNFTYNMEHIRNSTNKSVSFFSWLLGSLSFTTLIIIFVIVYIIFRYFSNIRNSVRNLQTPLNIVQKEIIPWFQTSAPQHSTIDHKTTSSIELRDFHTILKNELEKSGSGNVTKTLYPSS